MKPAITFRHEFVDSFPLRLAERTLYISMRFASAAHNCACGCGNQVITPITPTDWQLTYDGESITLHPSIGNWNFPCRAHYFISKNKVQWAPQWTKEQIEAGRAHDRWNKGQRFAKEHNDRATRAHKSYPAQNGVWKKLKALFL